MPKAETTSPYLVRDGIIITMDQITQAAKVNVQKSSTVSIASTLAKHFRKISMQNLMGLSLMLAP